MQKSKLGFVVAMCLALAAFTAPLALAQHGEEGHHDADPVFDTTVGPMIMPTTDDFVASGDAGGTPADPDLFPPVWACPPTSTFRTRSSPAC
jgi:hypothetical protein